MSSLEDLSDKYNEFWETREAIKARQRQQLEDELAPQRQALQRAIFKVQADYHYTVGQVAEAIGNTRNFVYLIRNDKPLIETDPQKRKERGLTTRIRPVAGLAQKKIATIEKIDAELSNEATVLGWEYSLDRAERSVWITKLEDGEQAEYEYHYKLNEWNVMTTESMPEDWYSDPNMSEAQRSFYRNLIEDINKNAVQAPPQTLE